MIVVIVIVMIVMLTTMRLVCVVWNVAQGFVQCARIWKDHACIRRTPFHSIERKHKSSRILSCLEERRGAYMTSSTAFNVGKSFKTSSY